MGITTCMCAQSAAENTLPIQPVSCSVPTDSVQPVPDCRPQENLELLALVVETDTLQNELKASQQQLSKQILLNEQLRRENQQLKEQSKSVKLPKTRPSFSVEIVQDSPIRDNFKYYTGFIYVQFMSVFKFLVPNKFECPINFSRTISSVKDMRLEDQFLLTIVKLRLNLQFKHLANLFEISPQDAGALFRQWINNMFYRFDSVPIWPEREVNQDHMPQKFKEDFPNTFIILDGTELKVQKPSSLRSQTQCYSDYKSHTTVKGLVGVDPRGSFTFISMLFSGSMSDKEITTASGLLDMFKQLIDCGRLKQGDGVMVDKGFHIKDEIEKLGLKLFIPPFAPGAGQMSAGDVALTRKIAAHCVHVERAISRAKKFKIVANRMDLTLFPCVNQIWFNCCFLTGSMPLLINEKD